MLIFATPPSCSFTNSPLTSCFMFIIANDLSKNPDRKRPAINLTAGLLFYPLGGRGWAPLRVAPTPLESWTCPSGGAPVLRVLRHRNGSAVKAQHILLSSSHPYLSLLISILFFYRQPAYIRIGKSTIPFNKCLIKITALA